MKYLEKYTNDDLFDMFANQADVVLLANQALVEIQAQLVEISPDMADAREVAAIVKSVAYDAAYGPASDKPYNYPFE